MRNRLVIGVSRNFYIVLGIPHHWRSKMHRHKRIAAGFASLALLVGLAAAACTQPGASASPSAMMASPSAMMESPSAMMESPAAMMESPSAMMESPSAMMESPSAMMESPSPTGQ